jgi:hypothetical protein
MFLIKITSIFGGKKAVKSLGAFLLVVFGTCLLVFQFQLDVLEPFWIIWVFRGGAVLGLILLVGGLFASDVSETK